MNLIDDKKTTLAGFEPARENPMDFKSIALTTRSQCLNKLFLPNLNLYDL